jgi:hypothetical protein
MSKNVEDESPFEDDVHYFPQADDEAMRRFAVPFLKMMFAHANFEGVFRDLLNAVARDKTFSAKRKNRWTANERAEKMRQLMIEHGCEDAEIATAHRVLSDAFPLCNDRNLLAHGDWWQFDPTSEEVTVMGDREREGQRTSFSAETLADIAERLDTLEVELWRVKRAIERRARTDD